jgi:hypothetical protein
VPGLAAIIPSYDFEFVIVPRLQCSGQGPVKTLPLTIKTRLLTRDAFAHCFIFQELNINALNFKETVEHAPRFYDPEEVPLEGIVSGGWRDLILMPDKQGHLRVDRLKYELCVLQALRERLR